jgi:plastocyanin
LPKISTTEVEEGMVRTMKDLLRQRSLIPLAAVVTVSLAGALAASTAFGGPDARSSKASTSERVSIKDDLFSPRSVTVARGGEVTWRWKGENEHNVRFRRVPSGASKRGAHTKTSGRFSRTFGKTGKYRYVCSIHEDLGMTGSVRVE